MISVVFLAVTVIIYRAEVYDEMSIVSTLDYELDWSFYTSTLLSILMQLEQENFHSGRGVRIYPLDTLSLRYPTPYILHPRQGAWDQIYLPSGKDVGVEIPYPGEVLVPGIRDTLPSPWTDQHLRKHYLPTTSLAVGKYKRITQQVCFIFTKLCLQRSYYNLTLWRTMQK